MEKINMFSLWKSFRTAVNTSQGGFYRPQKDFQQKVNDISKELWVEWTNLSDKSEEARDNLIFFLKSKNLKTTAGLGNFATFELPKDYGRFSGMRLIVTSQNKTIPSEDVDKGRCKGWENQEEINEEYYEHMSEVNVQRIGNIRWAAVLQHPNKFPTMEYPYATMVDGKFRVSPRDVSVVVLDYYIEPVPGIFGYKETPGDRQTGAGAQIVYVQSDSNDLPWPDTLRNEFIIRLGKAFGIFTRDQFLTAVNVGK